MTCQRIPTHTFTESVLQDTDSILNACLKSLSRSFLGGSCWKIWDQRLGHHLCVRWEGCKVPEWCSGPLWCQYNWAARGGFPPTVSCYCWQTESRLKEMQIIPLLKRLCKNKHILLAKQMKKLFWRHHYNWFLIPQWALFRKQLTFLCTAALFVAGCRWWFSWLGGWWTRRQVL